MVKKILSIIIVLVMLVLFGMAWSYAGRQEHGDIKTTEEVLETTAESTEDDIVTLYSDKAEEQIPKTIAARLLFGGDFNMDEEYGAINTYIEGGVLSCFGRNLLVPMHEADIFMVSNVSAITDRTKHTAKRYAFRCEPQNAALLSDIGVDLVSLANNHSFDYGTEGFLDTVDALDALGISAVGAGENYSEASAPFIQNINGIDIAILSAMCSEKYVSTPEATEAEAGVMKMYETDAICREIGKAKEEADIVIVYAHFGDEDAGLQSEAQIAAAYNMVDAGADVILGAHTHTVLEVEYYKGKPIFYGLGDLFWAGESRQGALAALTVFSDGSMNARLFPIEIVNGEAAFVEGFALEVVLDRLNNSSTAVITKDYLVNER